MARTGDGRTYAGLCLILLYVTKWIDSEFPVFDASEYTHSTGLSGLRLTRLTSSIVRSVLNCYISVRQRDPVTSRSR